MLNGGIEALRTAQQFAAEGVAAGHVVNGADKVPQALERLCDLQKDFTRRWPFFCKEEAERGAREIVEGKFVTGEDLLRELQGHCG